VLLEVFNNLFMNIAEQMGLRLQNTAYSVNIKERLDFSCALFDARRQLIANAPHMPVHLGSMGESRQDGDRAQRRPHAAGRRLCAQRPVPRRHAPARRHRDHAGVRRRRREEILFYVGSRGHHADIGGITPGSMPPFSTRIDEEGVLIDNFLLVERAACARPRCARCSQRPHPARNPDQNLADLRAQIAANEKGVQELRAWSRSSASTSCGLHAPRAGQRRGVGAPRDHRNCGRRLRAAAGQRRPHRVKITIDRRRAQRRPSTSPAPARSCRTTSTRRRR
jgi:5-oxoprolinase (ATP-hydrolysing)